MKTEIERERGEVFVVNCWYERESQDESGKQGMEIKTRVKR